MTKILFIDKPEYFKTEDIIWFDVPENKDKEDLISSIEKGLDFLVGSTNWDSLDENLLTGEWAKKKKVVLNHKFFPNLNEKDLKIYFSIINDDSFVFDLNNNEVSFSEKNIEDILKKTDINWALIAIFPTKFKEKVLGVLNNH